MNISSSVFDPLTMSMSSSRSYTFFGSNSTISGLDDIQNPKFSYTGNFDEKGFRDKFGHQTWGDPYQHKYAGNFIYNNMHGSGFYFIQQENNRTFFDGQMYNNKLEGYGQIIYNDGNIFEGLFKENKRFGPGVLSYPDGSQDVGFWNGNSLTRLSISVSTDSVPALCTTSSSKMKLLRFKRLVPALPERTDRAKIVMKKLGADKQMMQKYQELYNPHVRNENSLFFDRRHYDLSQFGSENAIIETLEGESLIDVLYDNFGAEDDSCRCVNERCVHINNQLHEIEQQLKKVRDLKNSYEKDLQKCLICCTEAPDSDVCKLSADNISHSEEKKYPSLVSVTEKSNSIKQSSVASNKGSDAEDSINRIFVNKAECRSDQSYEGISSETTPVSKPVQFTCTCKNDIIPDVDHLTCEIEKLQKDERFFQTVLDFLNTVQYKQIAMLKTPSARAATKLYVEKLMAWNNEKLSIDILQHCFRYRNYETNLTFRIKSLLIGDRKLFGKIGKTEKKCINFFKHCEQNKTEEVETDILEFNINPDLCDARGNTGLHCAVTKDCHAVIRLLANLGANLNSLNDECLTPLLICILRYIAVLYGVSSWETAFLPNTLLNPAEIEQITHWRPHESLVSLGELKRSSCDLLRSESRISSIQIQQSSVEISAKMKDYLHSVKSQASHSSMDYLLSTAFNDDCDEKKSATNRTVSDVDEQCFNSIHTTISLLLNYGADPNIGETPLSPLLLAIFSKNVNLVEELLKNRANPNVTTEENLTALHITSSLPFSSENNEIAKKFLKYSCNPNIKTKPEHWMEQNEELIGNYNCSISDIVEGKTPLQLILMRKDFDEENVKHQCDLAKMFIENGAFYKEHFLGHSVLSLAALRGNTKLVETLYPYVRGNHVLGCNMGNALTILGLNRFPSPISFSRCKDTIDKLLQLGMNPFDPIYNFSNIFEFFSNDYSEDIYYNNTKFRTALEAEYTILRKSLLNDKNNFSKNCNKLSVTYLKEIARKGLITMCQYRCMQYLLEFASEDLLFHKCLENIAKFFTLEEAIECLKVLIHNGKINNDSLGEDLIPKVLEFIMKCIEKPKPKKGKTSTSIPLESLLPIRVEPDFKVPTYYTMYVFDKKPEKYEVCFHCLKKTDKNLVACPCCGTVKFCSEECNKFNNKSTINHPCNVLFYNAARTTSDDLKLIGKTPSTQLDALLSEAREMRNKEKREQIKAQIIEETNIRPMPSIEITQKPEAVRMQYFSRLSSRETFPEPTVEPVKCPLPPLPEVDEGKVCKTQKQTCGFHCGHLIPDIKIDDDGNIIRELDFCKCYPMFRRDSGAKQKTGLEIAEFGKPKYGLDGDIICEVQAKVPGIPPAKPRLSLLQDQMKEKAPQSDTPGKAGHDDDEKDKYKKYEEKITSETKANLKYEASKDLKKQKDKKHPSKSEESLGKKKKNKKQTEDEDEKKGKDKKSKKKNLAATSSTESGVTKTSKKKKGKKGDEEQKDIKEKKDKKAGKIKDKGDKEGKEKTKKGHKEGKHKDKKGDKGIKEKKSKKPKVSIKKLKEKIRGETKKSKKLKGGKLTEETLKEDKMKSPSSGQGQGPSRPSTGFATQDVEQERKSSVSQRISKPYGYFMELLARYFPDFDFSCLFVPFACFMDGQLYYKFCDPSPYFCRTYSSV